MITALELDERQRRIIARAETDDRQWRRVRVVLKGTCLTADRREHSCELAEVSAGGVKIMTDAPLDLNDRIVLLTGGLGRLEGRVLRLVKGGAAVLLRCSDRKRERIIECLTWIAHEQGVRMQDQRRSPRFPLQGRTGVERLDTGHCFTAGMIDVSATGMLLTAPKPPEIGAQLRVLARRAIVVRLDGEKFAVHFCDA